jgi:hypothetical protein
VLFVEILTISPDDAAPEEYQERFKDYQQEYLRVGGWSKIYDRI